jgi:hypothetical protein
LDFIQQLSAQQSGTSAPFSGVLTEPIKLFRPEIEKLEGQIVSHGSGDFIVVFRKPFNAVFCAISLHRMFAALSQALPELERIQLRIAIYADSSNGDDTQERQNSIDKAHALKELVPGGRIFVSPAIVSTIGDAFDLKPAGEHRLTAAAEPLGVFELTPPPMKPLETRRRFHSSQLGLPLAAALALLIIGSTAYGYMGHTRLTESALALWSWIPLERVHQQFQFLLGTDQSSAISKTPSKREALPRSQPQPAQKELSPAQDRQSAAVPAPSRAPVRRLPVLPASEQLERHEVTEPLLARQAALTIPATKPRTRQLPPDDSSHPAAISIPKPRPRPAQRALQQMEVSTAPGVITGSAEGPVSILPDQALEQNARVAALPAGCEALRQAYARGALAPGIDQAAYKRLLKCQQQKLYYNRERPQRSDAAGNQQRADGGAASGGDGGSGGGPGGGKSNGRGNGKGN